MLTTQHYLLGTIMPGRLSPRHTLSSYGLEGDNSGEALFDRTVIGGTGRHAGARGWVRQSTIGTNTTTLNVEGVPAPNFRFRFHLS